MSLIKKIVLGLAVCMTAVLPLTAIETAKVTTAEQMTATPEHTNVYWRGRGWGYGGRGWGYGGWYGARSYGYGYGYPSYGYGNYGYGYGGCSSCGCGPYGC